MERVGDLEAYLPRWLLRSAAGGDAPLAASAKGLWAVVLFADISGFTQMTRLYQVRGDAGVEELALTVGRYLGGLIDSVFARGGDVEKLYGDAFLAFWPASDSDREEAIGRALACAAEMVRLYDNQVAEGGTPLRLRVALACGPLRAVQAGGRSGQWQFFLAGPSLGGLSDMLAAAPPGRVISSQSLRAALPRLPEIALPAQIDAVVRTGGSRPAPVAGGTAPREWMRAFLPAPLRRQDAVSVRWLAEFRWLAVVALGIEDLRCDEESDLAATQRAVTVLQDGAESYDGALVSFSMSEKGPMAIVAFGLPGQTHDDDAARAARLALDVQAALGPACRAAATFGLAYCGVIGNRQRRDYAIIGDALNRAAKLIGRKDAPPLVCDRAIAERAGPELAFEPVASEREAPLFRPSVAAKAPARGRAALRGRESEIEWLRGRLDAAESGVALYLEGEAGVGKSALVSALAEMAGERGLFLAGGADSFAGAAQPFAAWRAIFAQIFPMSEAPEALLETLSAALAAQDLPAERAGLASVVFPALPAKTPEGLLPDDVARLTCETLTALLRHAAAGRRAILALDDAHWMDTGSWMLAAQAASEVPGALPVLLARPAPERPWPGMDKLASIRVERLRLEPLSRAAIREVVVEAFGADLPEEWSQALVERSGGNPLFARQLALSLRDERPAVAEKPMAPRLPDSIQRAVVARFDRLPGDLQVVLKTSSVVGATFLLRAVAALLTQDEGEVRAAALREQLDRLVEIGMIAPERRDPEPAYRFDHALTQEAIYNLLSFENRRRLHAAVAGFLEAEPDARQPGPATLGLHWSRAGRPDRAQPNWEAAGKAALAAGAYREAAAALSEALTALQATADRSGARAGRLRHALGEALLQSGEIAQSKVHLVEALRDFGYPWAPGPFSVAGALASAVGTRIAQEARTRQSGPPLQPLGAGGGKAEIAAEAALTLESLGQAFAHRSQLLSSVTATLCALNLARRAGDAPIYTRAAGLMSLVLSVASLPGLAERYLGHARRHLPEVEAPHDRLMSTEYIAMALLSAGRLSEAKPLLVGMRALAAQSSNRRRLLDATSLLILTLLEREEHEACAELIGDFVIEAERAGDPQLRSWSLLEAAELALRRGDLEAAERSLASAQKLAGRVGRNEQIWTAGMLSLLEWRKGRGEEALAKASEVAAEMASWRSVSFYAHSGAFAAAEVYLEQLAADRAAGRTEARKLVSRAHRSGLRFAVTRARALTAMACHAHLSGRPAVAAPLFERSAAHARDFELRASLSASLRWRERLGV